MLITTERRPRFHRVNTIPTFQLTNRDVEIIRHVFQHRFLKSSHLCALVNGSDQGILRRLQLLYHHGYLDRPRAQLDYYHRHHNTCLVYGLGNKGALLLEELDGIPSRKVDWSVKNQCATRLFLQHTLMVADFMVALELSCHERGIRLRRFAGADDSSANGVDSRWQVSLRETGKYVTLGVVPDAMFELTPPEQPTTHFCLEVDRATMPVKRRTLEKTSFHRKLLTYHATWKQGVLSHQFGWDRFRVLTLTTSPERVEHLRGGAKELPSGHGLFLFAHRRQLHSDADLLTLPWLPVCHNEPATLLDS